MTKQNIYHRKDGRWEGRIPLFKDENGRRRFVYIYSKSKEKAAEKIAAFHKKTRVAKCGRTFSEVYREWYENIRFHVKESTLANYRMKAECHLLPAFGGLSLTAITSKKIYAFIDKKISDGLSVRYVSDILVLMKSVVRYAVRRYHTGNPFDNVTMPKKRSDEVRLLDENQQGKLRRYIAENPDPTALGVALSMSTGIRIGELCALKWSDIDLEKRILTVSKACQRIQAPEGGRKTKLIITEPKSESSKRQIPIPDCLMEMLSRFQASADYYVLSGTRKPVEPRTMQYRFARILKNAKLPSVHFHALRHMFATTCVKLGFDIKALSEMLGHSSVEITLNRYVHSSFEQKERYMSLLSFDF